MYKNFSKKYNYSQDSVRVRFDGMRNEYSFSKDNIHSKLFWFVVIGLITLLVVGFANVSLLQTILNSVGI